MLVDVFRVLFALSVLVAGAALAAAALDVVGRRVLLSICAGLGALAVAAWIAFALQPSASLAVAAGGILAALLAAGGAIGVEWGVRRNRRLERDISVAEGRLRALIEREADERATELEHVLARARADSASLLAEEERRISDERRAAIVARERASAREVADALAATQQRVEQRLAEWSEDLERAQENLAMQVQQLGTRQKRMLVEAEERLGAATADLETHSEMQRANLVKLREDLERATAESVEAARAELEAHAADRRRALHELNERLRRRERELRERVEREENEVTQRINAAFTDIDRRLIERVERVVERMLQQHAEAATIQFADTIKRSREDSARRLARELDRAVAAFAHQAETILAERLGHVGDNAAQGLERRLADAASGLERQRDDFVASLEQRLAVAEEDVRRRLGELVADADAERGVLEARLHELSRRIEQTLAHAETAGGA